MAALGATNHEAVHFGRPFRFSAKQVFLRPQPRRLAGLSLGGGGGARSVAESGAVDILNIHGNISDGMRAAWLANDHGLQVSVGNTSFEMGVHLAAALPGDTWMEYSFPNYNVLLEEPVQFENGYALAPEVPGHGLRIAEPARAQYAQPQIGDLQGIEPPPSLIHWPKQAALAREK